MRFLLDTHSLLWFLAGSSGLSPAARRCIEDIGNELWVSVVSLWEIGIKTSLGKFHLHQPFEKVFPAQLQQNSIEILPIKVEHVYRVTQLPFHHRDPFDRLLIAQAVLENLTLISPDKTMDKYNVTRLW